MKLPTTALIGGVLLLSCAPRTDRPVAPGDLIFGQHPGRETVLRVKAPCPVPSDIGATYVVPTGDYHPVSADSRGLFYEAPLGVELRHGDQSVWLFGAGVYVPFSMRPDSKLYLWTEAVSLEWGTKWREKRWPLPEQCWRPYGPALAIVHNGVEISQH